MQISTTLELIQREDWRAWLQTHYQTAPEIWLVSYQKASGRPRLAYHQAVEEALCFGWIDSTVKRLDEQRLAQRFSPRRRGSPYSQPNQERLRHLVAEGKVMPEVLASLGDLLEQPFVFPPDILQALQANSQAWAHFQRYYAPYQRIRVAFVDAARRRPAEFQKRLRHFIRMTEQDKQFGFGIEDFFGRR